MIIIFVQEYFFIILFAKISFVYLFVNLNLKSDESFGNFAIVFFNHTQVVNNFLKQYTLCKKIKNLTQLFPFHRGL